jgi:hypothetical protein
MQEEKIGTEKRLEYLTDQLSYLMVRLDQLSSRVTALENGKVAVQKEIEQTFSMKQIPPQPDQVWDMVGRETLFSRTAAVCFILVFALMLRTITDNGIIDPAVGAAVGIIYTISLILWGWRLISRKHVLAPVFPICGALLFFTIIWETHVNFNVISENFALFSLFVIEILLAVIGFGYRKAFLVYLATLGATLTAISLNFPNNHFAGVALLLLSVNVLSLLIQRARFAKALPWSVLIMTILFLLLWAFKLSVPLSRNESPEPFLSQHLFLPLLFTFFLLFFGSLLQRVRSNPEPLGFFHGMLPTINVVFTFLAAMTVTRPWFGSLSSLGIAGSFAGLMHFVLAGILGHNPKKGAPGCNALVFAGAVCTSISLPLAFGMILALPMLSTLAFLLAVLSDKWQSGGVRFTSYLQQGMVCLTFLLTLPEQLRTPSASALAAFFLALMAVLQYSWCRKYKPPKQDSAYFAWLDRRDMGAVILLLSGMVGCFGLFRIGLYLILSQGIAGYQNAFSCGQTIIINMGAIGLMYIASRRKNLEILIVSLTVSLLSAIKVFVFDLFTAKGFPLVISVFTFGIVALAGSLVLKNWQYRERPVPGKTQEISKARGMRQKPQETNI